MKTIVEKIGTHLVADEGKLLRRKQTNEGYGKEIYLGYSHYIGGIKLDEPHMDVPEDFEEYDDPEYKADENTAEKNGPETTDEPNSPTEE